MASVDRVLAEWAYLPEWDKRARHSGPNHRKLEEIQSTLSGGVDAPRADDPIAHLAGVAVAEVGGRGFSIVTLWVPQAQEGQALELLKLAGYEDRTA